MAMDILPESKSVDRIIPDSLPGSHPGEMNILTDEEGRFLININASTGEGAGIYMNRAARQELIRILLDTL